MAAQTTSSQRPPPTWPSRPRPHPAHNLKSAKAESGSTVRNSLTRPASSSLSARDGPLITFSSLTAAQHSRKRRSRTSAWSSCKAIAGHRSSSRVRRSPSSRSSRSITAACRSTTSISCSSCARTPSSAPTNRRDARTAPPAGRGPGQRVRGRGAHAGAACSGAVRPLRSRLLPTVRRVRRVRRSDGPPAAHGDQACGCLRGSRRVPAGFSRTPTQRPIELLVDLRVRGVGR